MPGTREHDLIVPVARENSSHTPSLNDPPAYQEAAPLAGSSWIWYPEGNPRQDAPAGRRSLRRQFELPADPAIRRALVTLTADNRAVLHVNGKEAGQSHAGPEAWRQPVELDVATLLHPGGNSLVVHATNAPAPALPANPAGVLGCLRIEFADGSAMTIRTDAEWVSSRNGPEEDRETNDDDSSWRPVKVLGPWGIEPWGRPGARPITLSPVAAPDPFMGTATLPEDFDPQRTRAFLEMEDLGPEQAARVSINGKDAGGFLSPPLRLEVGPWLQPGINSLRIEPFAPSMARLILRPR